MKTCTPPNRVSAIVITAILFAFTFTAHAELGANWRLRSPQPWADSLTGVVATNTRLVAVGRGSAVPGSAVNVFKRLYKLATAPSGIVCAPEAVQQAPGEGDVGRNCTAAK